MEKKILVVDTNAYIHRNYHALDERLDVKGKCNKVSHGVFNLIKKLDSTTEIDELIMVVDSDDGSMYRQNIYSDYKANRSEKEEELNRQKRDLVHILKNVGIPVVIHSQYEADDAIASIAKRESGLGNYVMVVSPDKDLMQVVSERVFIMKNFKDGEKRGFTYVDEAGVKEFLGVEPRYVSDLLALMGDTSDNIPGIDGMGVKTAAKIINNIGGIDMIVNNIPELIKLKINKKIIEQIENKIDVFPMIKQLTTVVDNLDVNVPLLNLDLYNRKKNVLVDYYNMPDYVIELDYLNKKHPRPKI